MPSYWVLQALHAHASNLNIVRENNSERKQTKTKTFILKGNLQWPCSSFWIQLMHRRGFHRQCAALYYKYSLSLFLLLDSLRHKHCRPPTTHCFQLDFNIPIELRTWSQHVATCERYGIDPTPTT